MSEKIRLKMNYNFDEIVNRNGSHCVKYDSREQIFGRQDVVPLWVADTDFRTPDFIVEAVIQRARHEVYGYPIRPESYDTAVQNWLKQQHGWTIDREGLSVIPNVVVGLASLVLSLTQPGDGIIVQPPVYFPFFHVVKGNDRTMTENPLKLENGRYHFDLEDLKAKIDSNTKMLLLCNPHNPGGMVWQRDELEALGKICLEHNIIVVSDEIHADLVLPGSKHLPFALVSPDHSRITVTAMAASKTFNVAGLSSAFLVFSDSGIHKRYKKFEQATHLNSVSFFGLVATEAAFSYGAEWLRQLITYLDGNRTFIEQYISEKIPGIRFIHPEATFLMWLDFSAYGLSDTEVFQRLVDCGVGLNPGNLFGTGGTGYMRLNFGCPRSVLETGLKMIEKEFGRTKQVRKNLL